MLICGVARSACSKRTPPGAAGDEVGRLGRDLHQPARARVRGLVAEARLLVDDRRDQRGVEVLVGGLLADDVVVAQRERDLAHRLAQRARAGHNRGHQRASTASGGHRQRRRRRRARARAGRRAMRAACELTAGRVCASTRDNVSFNSSSDPSLRTTKSALCAFSCWLSWRPARSATAACPRARGALLASPPRRRPPRSCCRTPPPCRPRTAAAPRRPPRGRPVEPARQAATRSPTRGHSTPSSQARASSSPNTRSAIRARSRRAVRSDLRPEPRRRADRAARRPRAARARRRRSTASRRPARRAPQRLRLAGAQPPVSPTNGAIGLLLGLLGGASSAGRRAGLGLLRGRAPRPPARRPRPASRLAAPRPRGLLSGGLLGAGSRAPAAAAPPRRVSAEPKSATAARRSSAPLTCGPAKTSSERPRSGTSPMSSVDARGGRARPRRPT